MNKCVSKHISLKAQCMKQGMLITNVIKRINPFLSENLFFFKWGLMSYVKQKQNDQNKKKTCSCRLHYLLYVYENKARFYK